MPKPIGHQQELGMDMNKPGKVLVVEDDSKLAFIVAAHLRRSGYEVAEAGNGQEAVDLTGSFGPDVIIMDVTMPVMDGVEATRLLKKDPETAHIPVLMLTGKSRTEDLVLGLEAGAQEYMSKPFELNELIARVGTMLRLSRAHKALDSLNDQLSDQVRAKTRQLELLYNCARSLNEASSAKEIYRLVVNAVADLTASKRISLLLKEPDSEFLRCVEAKGIEPEVVRSIRIRAIDGIAGQVFTSGKTLTAQAHGGSSDAEWASRYHSDTFISTPLICTAGNFQNEVLGVLNITERTEGGPFCQDEIDCIRSIADSAAVAIRNQQQTQRLQDSIKVLLLTVGRLAEYRDEETTDHLDRVAAYARILTRALAKSEKFNGTITPDFINDIYMAAPLHDIGKVGIPDDILTKPGKLTDEEYNIMKTHTDIGRRTLEFAMGKTGPVPMLQMCIDIAYCHHEKYNGRGYPRRIAGDAIPLAARIIALVDAYDAITSRRRYSEPRSHEQAVEIVRADAGKHFDPDVVEAFLRCAHEFDRIRGAHWPTESTADGVPARV